MKRHVLIFGIVGDLLIVTLQYTEYRFYVIEHSVELYGAVVAILFASFGMAGPAHYTSSRIIRETVVVKEVLVPIEAAGAAASQRAPFRSSHGPAAGHLHHGRRA